MQLKKALRRLARHQSAPRIAAVASAVADCASLPHVKPGEDSAVDAARARLSAAVCEANASLAALPEALLAEVQHHLLVTLSRN